MEAAQNSYPQQRLMLVLSDFFPPGIHAIFTDRNSGLSLAQGEISLTPEQEETAAACFSIPDSVFVPLRQVHGNRIVVYERGGPGPFVPFDADGCLTKSSRCWISVRTADCLPVFLCDPRNRCVGVVHAGWRGTRDGIVREAVARMRDAFGSDPAEMSVVLGPCIRPCCYTVGPEFRDFFPEDVRRQGPGLVLDLAGANIRQLEQGGVPVAQVHDCGACTCCDTRFFSYRREGASCGRNLALMVMA